MIQYPKGTFLYAQACTEGFYCELGSSSPMGNGLCPRGFTCPIGTAVPVPTPPGTFAQMLGTVEPASCLPDIMHQLLKLYNVIHVHQGLNVRMI